MPVIHPAKEELEALFPAVRAYQTLASRYLINDIFQDNGGKILKVIIDLNMAVIPGREGNDAVDAQGYVYELKSLNVDLQSDFTTHHHLNSDILAKYRQVFWIFAGFHGIELDSLHVMAPHQLEPYFARWEAKFIETGIPRNNPKIPMNYVKRHGVSLFNASTPNAQMATLEQARELAGAKPTPASTSAPAT